MHHNILFVGLSAIVLICGADVGPLGAAEKGSQPNYDVKVDRNVRIPMRGRFLRAMRAEGVYASPPGGSNILPISRRIENKVTVHPDWPSFNSPEGKAIRYGKACCPRTINIQECLGGVIMDPNFTDEDVADIVRAIRKVYLAMGPGY